MPTPVILWYVLAGWALAVVAAAAFGGEWHDAATWTLVAFMCAHTAWLLGRLHRLERTR